MTSQKAAAPAPTPRIPCPKLLTSSPLWPSSHGFIVLGRGRGARLTSQKAAAPPSCSLHRLHGSSLSWPSSHGRRRMASLCLAGGGCSVD